MSRRINRICENPKCAKEFSPLISEVKKGGGKYCSRKCCSEKRKIDYIATFESIQKCKECDKFIDIVNRPDRRNAKFCNSSCAAKYNNKRRRHSKETKQKMSESHIKRNIPETRNYYSPKKNTNKISTRVSF